MSGSDKTSLGNRMKSYEKRFSQNFLKMIPIIARVDGRSFSKFTSGLERPYDQRMSRLMIDVTKYLVEQTNARCGYTQSDEISLVWLADDFNEELFFGGKLLKMTSVIGSLATVYFNKHLSERIPEKANKMTIFDNRVWEVPTENEAVNYFIWREQDAVRNSIQGAARAHFSHSECMNKNGSQLHEMLFEKGVNWAKYPTHFKRGIYVRKRTVDRSFTQEELDKLPPKHEFRKNPNLAIRRSVIMEEEFPILTQIKNRVDVILHGADPVFETEDKTANLV